MAWTCLKWMAARQRGRTELLWLCKYVLGFKDVVPHVHGPVAATLQRFYGGTDEVSDKCNGSWQLKGYIPKMTMWEMPIEGPGELGSRRTLILIPRGHLKTTVATVAHTIQWIINYPDVRVMISTASGTLAKEIMDGIKNHFTKNELFRFLYPEFCPTMNEKKGRVVEFGNQEEFTVPNRKDFTKKEPTVSVVTVGTTISGRRADVMKHDDMVDKENVRTAEGIATVRSHYQYLDPLIETSSIKPFTGWEDVIGTPYSHSDIYEELKRQQRETGRELRRILIMSAAKNYPEGPALWPERVPMEALHEKEIKQGPEVFSSQYLMNPRPSSSGLVDSREMIKWIPRKELSELYPRLRLHVTVDLAGMEPQARGKNNDYTVINLHGFGRDGSLYILEVLHSRKVTPEDVINHLFSLVERHPRIFDIKVEKEAHARVLLPFMKREMSRRNKWLPVVPLQRDNRTSKVQRIKGLQPWFRNGSIKFANDLNCKVAMEDEILFFPKYDHDDILDTIADAMQNRDGEVVNDVLPMPRFYAEQEERNPFDPPSVDAQELDWNAVTGERYQGAVAGVDSVTGW